MKGWMRWMREVMHWRDLKGECELDNRVMKQLSSIQRNEREFSECLCLQVHWQEAVAKKLWLRSDSSSLTVATGREVGLKSKSQSGSSINHRMERSLTCERCCIWSRCTDSDISQSTYSFHHVLMMECVDAVS